MKVAELFGWLGIKVDKASFSAGEKALGGVGKAVRDASGRWRDASGRFLASAPGWHGVLDKINASATKLAAGLKKVATIGVAMASVASGAAVVLSDSYTSLENRIKQVSSSTSEMEELMDRTRAIANATRSDWGATGEAFVRLKNATKDLNLSTNQQLDLVTTLNMALQSSGASASEAAAGTLQLMQGLAAGALQGDEFRSIAEQLPDLMDVFAKELKVSRGELKKLGSEGKITAKVVVSALQNASSSIRDEFVASTATAAQGWVVLKNNLTLAAATIVRSTGIMDGLGRAVVAVTDWVEENRDGIADFASVVGDAISMAASVAGEAFSIVGDVIGWFRDGSDEAMAVLIAIAAVIVATVVPALWSMGVAWVAALWPILLIIAAIAAVAYGVIKLIKHWDKVKAAAGRVWDWIKEKISAFVDWLGALGSRVGKAIAWPFVTAYEFVQELLTGLVNFFIDKINWMIDKLNWVAKKASKLPGIELGTIDRIDKLGSPEAPSMTSFGGASTTNNMQVQMTINGATDPKQTGMEIKRALGDQWAREMRLAEGM